MKHLAWILILLMVACNGTKSTDKLLAEVWHRDQSIRLQMMKLTTAVAVDGRTELIDSLIATSQRVEDIDAQNMAIVESLIKDGVPRGLSADSYKTRFVIGYYRLLNSFTLFEPRSNAISNVT